MGAAGSERARFVSDLGFALRVAGRAPSSHNSQPWALAHVASPEGVAALGATSAAPGTEHLVLALDRARELTALPAHRLEMHLSCGMYLHLLLEALAAAGWRSRPLWTDGPGQVAPRLPGWPERWRPLAALRLEPAGPDRSRLPGLEAAVAGRITNRAPYATEALSGEALGAAAAPLPAGRLTGEVSPPPVLWTERTQIEAVARFVGDHAGIDFRHRAAWRETHAFIRWTDPQIRAAEDGFAITQLFGPLPGWRRALMRLALAPATMALLEHVGYPERVGKEMGGVVAQSGALAAFCLPGPSEPEPSVARQLDAGAHVLTWWLRVGAAGLVVHPVSVVLQHPAIRERLEVEHHLPGRCYFLARLGRPLVHFPPAPRRADPQAPLTTL